MNGIIHNCTHKDSGDTQFRLSEEEMFIRIFNYIEHLFGKIKPKQLFFMAIDGVAPRAKMNQQRARRFRTALDAEKARDKAIKEGQTLPKEEPFDSNCITPGTEFMAKLSQQLRYFINKKVSEDKEWQQPDIVLSGHDVPGEGEHKIMEYIRNARAQPGYNANIRHCLYGLDADLIMLGLLSHDPHFCLLREEVTFGRAAKNKSQELEHQNFYLLHLCIVREYLELEFQELKEPGVMNFPFDMEKVIDDFILMGFFVGNDFLPNLPRLHINEGALALMFRIYKRVLPKCDGYINEGGKVNIKRLGYLLEEVSQEEYRFFEHEVSDEKWFRSKKLADDHDNAQLKAQTKGKVIVSSKQKELWKKKLRKFVQKQAGPTLDLGADLKAEDRKFVQDLAETTNLQWSTKEDDEGRRHLVLSLPETTADDDTDDNEEDEEAVNALYRIVRRYDNAEVVDLTAADAQAAMAVKYKEKFQEWKDKYYLEKFEEWTPENKDEELRKLTENYVQGLQWVLYYYYRGIASWPWFYRYHYSPLISDIMKGLNANLDFKLGQPFRPFEQLMGVLPDRSKKIVPEVYWPLMTDPDSPIIDFYPRDFELDMNGKKMDWEAVVKIPFIDEKRLLDAMKPKNELLSDDEKSRNDFGVPIKFTYNQDTDFTFPSSLVGIFPDISHCHCIENIFDLPAVEGLEFREGLMTGAFKGVTALAGFPSLATLPYTATLGFHGVNVFQQESRNESMVVTLSDTDNRGRAEVAKQKLGKRCHVGYPFLQEGKVVRVSDELFDYVLAADGSGNVIQNHHREREMDDFNKKAERIENFYSKRLGILIGNVESMVHVEMLKGLIKTDEGATVKEYGGIPGMETDYAAQVIVDSVINEDERFIERAALPIDAEFPIGSHAFFLGDFGYGRPLEVTGHKDNKLEIVISVLKDREPEFAKRIIAEAERTVQWSPSYHVARSLGIHPLTLSKITSSFFVWTVGGSIRVNLGLNLKFDGKRQKVLGYSRKSATGWEFSAPAVKLLTDYMVKFSDFFAGIMRNPQGSEVNDLDIWSEPAVAAARIKEIGAWLKAAGVNNFEKVPLDAEQLDSTVVGALVAATDQLNPSQMPTLTKTMKGVPRNALMRPDDAEQRLGNQHFALGDRIVYANSSGKVPLAIRGTVVGISRTPTAKLLDIVFDITFMSGTTVGDRAPAFRGQTVPATSVLNLTDRQVVAGSKATMARQTAAPSLTTLTTHGGFHGSPDPRHHLRDAAAPAPLQGSWRGAVNGNGSAGRGRGGANRNHTTGVRSEQGQPQRGSLNVMHSSLVYRNDSPNQGAQYGNGSYDGASGDSRGRSGQGRSAYRGAAGGQRGGRGGATNGDAKPTQSYNSVPPPANIDSRGRSRGRGRGGRGRGAGGANGKGPSRGGATAAA
jgi:5'-3' exoribonuclease 1